MASEKTYKKKRSMPVRTVRLAVLSVIFGLIVTVLSSMLIWVHKPSDLDRMSFGKPFPFIIQSYYGTIRDEYFPRPVHPQMSDESCTTEFLPAEFALSGAVNVSVVAVIFFGIFFLKVYLEKKKLKPAAGGTTKNLKDKGDAAGRDDSGNVSENSADEGSTDENNNKNPS